MRVSIFSPKSSSSSARDGSGTVASTSVSDMLCKDDDSEDEEDVPDVVLSLEDMVQVESDWREVAIYQPLRIER
jgi:hypothetical protein